MSLKFHQTFLFTVCQFLLFSFSASQSWDYKYYKALDLEGKYILGWRYNDTHIELQVTVQTTGYVGFGISRNGSMLNADMMMGWIQDNNIYLGDYHTRETRVPMMDSSQDWFVLNGTEINGTTVIEFSRRLDTCDPQDLPITNDRLQVIWSYANEDPDILTGLVPYHGAQRRGSAEIFFLENDAVPDTYPPPETFELPLKNHLFPIPANGSSLQCIVFDLKNVIPQSHLIKFKPEITPGNEAYVYRMVLYRCNVDDASLYGKRFHCDHEAPVAVKSCKSVVASWSMGAESFHFPDDIGIPMGGPSDPSTYVLEIHYSKFSEEIVDGSPISIPDNSGLVLTYTKSPVASDAAMLELGKVISPGWRQFIPDGVPDFTTASFCSPRCMDWGFGSEPGKKEPIRIVGVMFKGNDVAKKIKLRHFRGNQELPIISEDNNFSNFFQGPRLLKEPVIVRSTDTLSVECTFDTEDRIAVTRGGWSRVDEVCRATIVYYPPKPFDLCLSWSSFDKLKGKNGETIPEDEAIDYLANITSWTPPERQMFQTAVKESSERSICSSISRQPAYAIDRYKSKTMIPWIKPRTC